MGAVTGVLVATRVLRYLWASPNTALGLVGVLIAVMSGGRVRAVDGVLEASGGWLDLLLRAAFPVPGGALAMALGHVVLGRSDEALARTRRHERVHVEQSERWGLLFVPAYLLASVWALLRGGHAYLDNVFERDARRRAGD